MKKPLVSIIIRTKNEERWITSCLNKIFDQNFKDFEVIIVDNNSKDKTIEKTKQFKIGKVLQIKDFYPGKALNLGIKNSKGKYFVCLSAHCIPKDKNWLKNLIKGITKNKKFAGSYGRQEPMQFSSPADKRDMLITFGLDERIQKKDSFFHNANSIIKKKIWHKLPFDNKITNIEDRLWAQKVLNLGYSIYYNPEATVYHYHGIHQDGNKSRLNNVVNIIEKTNSNLIGRGKLDPYKLNIVAVIPIKGNTMRIGKKFLLNFTLDNLKKSKFIKKIFVSTDNKHTQKIAKQLGAECPFIRPKKFSKEKINLNQVQKYSINMIERLGYYPDIYVHLEETYPFRSHNLIDKMINQLLSGGYDSVIATKSEHAWLWKELKENKYDRIDDGEIPRKFKKKSLIGLHGLGCVTYPEFVRKGTLLGKKIGLFEIENTLSNIEIRNKESIALANKLLKSK